MDNSLCNYCKHPTQKGAKRCEYCGTLNPSLGTKEAFVWTVGMVFIFYVALRIMA